MIQPHPARKIWQLGANCPETGHLLSAESNGKRWDETLTEHRPRLDCCPFDLRLSTSSEDVAHYVISATGGRRP